jgi:thymidylate synthase ThyX
MTEYLSEVRKHGIYSRCVAASKSTGRPNVYSLEVRLPKWLDAEMEKHRMLSKNSSSSRAIPSSKTVSAIRDDPYIPFDVRRNQKGMQGYEKFEDTNGQFAKGVYELSLYALALVNSWPEVHKQHLNRYLEPWMYQTKIITGTEWTNFFLLRLPKKYWNNELTSEAEKLVMYLRANGREDASIESLGGEYAQPEMQHLAECMLFSMRDVPITHLNPGQWHLPYIEEDFDGTVEEAKLCSAARCARTSYKLHDGGTPDKEKDLKLANDLIRQVHAVPFEHQVTPMYKSVLSGSIDVWNLSEGITHIDTRGQLWSGNMRGWIQFRQLNLPWN